VYVLRSLRKLSNNVIAGSMIFARRTFVRRYIFLEDFDRKTLARRYIFPKDISPQIHLPGWHLPGRHLPERHLAGRYLPGWHLQMYLWANVIRANDYRPNVFRVNVFRSKVYWENVFRANVLRVNVFRAKVFRANVLRDNVSGQLSAGQLLPGIYHRTDVIDRTFLTSRILSFLTHIDFQISICSSLVCKMSSNWFENKCWSCKFLNRSPEKYCFWVTMALQGGIDLFGYLFLLFWMDLRRLSLQSGQLSRNLQSSCYE
jgi:hypothetical protein